jgi:hypothetical protein
VGSFYLNIGNDAANGAFTDWSISAPLYQDYLALGNEIGTHSWTHPDFTSTLSPTELEFEFNQSALEIGNQLGIQVIGAAVPGNPEDLNVVQQIDQWLFYLSGRFSAIGSGYQSAFGFLAPDHQMIYFSLNMLPDFTLIAFQGQTPAVAEQIWRDEMDALRLHASQPILHWLWHDYGPTIDANNGYGVAMYENTIAYAFNGGAEFTTLANMENRMRAFQQATLDVDGANGLTANVTAGAVGQFSLKVRSTQVIESVTGWYAYDDDQVFLPEGGGQFPIQFGSSAAALTRITALPMRARLLSVTGDGSDLTFSFEGEGEVTARLHPSLLTHPGRRAARPVLRGGRGDHRVQPHRCGADQAAAVGEPRREQPARPDEPRRARPALRAHDDEQLRREDRGVEGRPYPRVHRRVTSAVASR